MDCLFCSIIKGEIPPAKVFENEYVYAFRDINPNAKVHVLIVPKTHIDSVDRVDESNVSAVAEVLKAIPEIAKICGLSNGYRVITNVGVDGGQSVKHLHFHLLGGEKLPVRLA
jgi:histidine triad (HIT) family protein